MSDSPEYLRLLRNAWISGGRPTGREIAQAVGCTHSAVSKTLRGVTVPRLGLMKLMAHALAANEAQEDEILDAYTRFLSDQYEPVEAEDETGDIATAIREGLHDIAEAIRESSAMLTRALEPPDGQRTPNSAENCPPCRTKSAE